MEKLRTLPTNRSRRSLRAHDTAERHEPNTGGSSTSCLRKLKRKSLGLVVQLLQILRRERCMDRKVPPLSQTRSTARASHLFDALCKPTFSSSEETPAKTRALFSKVSS